MKIKKYCLSVVSIFVFFTVQAQTKLDETTSFGIYSGSEKITLVENDNVQFRDGNYLFTSELIPLVDKDIVVLKDLLINGTYLKNEKNGVWNYKYNTYILDDLSVKRTLNAALQHKLNGIEEEFKISYSDGNFNGSSTFSQRNISNGRFENPSILAEIEYVNDTLVGGFEIVFDGVEIKGETDNRGYLNNTLYLIYSVDGLPVLETRKYQNGFLLELEKRNPATDELLLTILYDDVKQMLSQLERNEENLDFEISDDFFGLKFNIGYQQTDKRVTEQLPGNDVLEKYLYLFDSIHNNNSKENQKRSILKFTNRFHFPSKSVEDSLALKYSKENKMLSEKIVENINKPNIVLRKNNSDTLFQQYQVLIHIKSKTDTIQQVLDKINSGYFDNRSIDKYYSDGIPGLSEIDTIHYNFGEDTLALPFRIDRRIVNSDSLIFQIGNYIGALDEKTTATIQKLSQSLTIYENQEKIDSLDRVISSLELNLKNKYPQNLQLTEEDLSKTSFSYRVYHSLNERFLTEMNNKYINNSLPQEEMITLGSSLICYYSFLDSNKFYLDKVSTMQKYWSDSLFTVYRDNPFDFRKLETPILEGVEHASTILLRQYANQLLNAKSCEQIEAELDKIVRLNERIEFLVKNQDSQNVQQLNKALRRERVANRIERLLEL
ncbi:hypothetical protein [Algoriphagus confluentis]|uniref:Uncharacterized protein n=1 Tax=Algoriphagus confluentis TaxID=1697556 RepID=A0ABQ6PI02_9BACT|nr:hypothetical protein Aconfl_01660 [Algoriphagus confluentis]